MSQIQPLLMEFNKTTLREHNSYHLSNFLFFQNQIPITVHFLLMLYNQDYRNLEVESYMFFSLSSLNHYECFCQLPMLALYLLLIYRNLNKFLDLEHCQHLVFQNQDIVSKTLFLIQFTLLMFSEDMYLVLGQLQQILKFVVSIFLHQKKILEQTFKLNVILIYIKMGLVQIQLFSHHRFHSLHSYQTQYVRHIYDQIQDHNFLGLEPLLPFSHSLFHRFQVYYPLTNLITHLINI